MKLNELFKTTDLKRKDVAERAGISRGYLSRIESGEKEPSLEMAYRIVDAVNALLLEQGGIIQPRDLLIEPQQRTVAN